MNSIPNPSKEECSKYLEFTLNDFTYRQVDNYLWKLGKEHVQEKGKKENNSGAMLVLQFTT